MFSFCSFVVCFFGSPNFAVIEIYTGDFTSKIQAPTAIFATFDGFLEKQNLFVLNLYSIITYV